MNEFRRGSLFADYFHIDCAGNRIGHFPAEEVIEDGVLTTAFGTDVVDSGVVAHGDSAALVNNRVTVICNHSPFGNHD